MHWILIPRSPGIAALADACGVDQIMVDLEVHGKAARQSGSGAHLSEHSMADVPVYASVLRRAELLVRVNPLGPHTGGEVNAAIAAGARRLMLPMFESAHEVERFLHLVDGRVPVTLLAETPAAVANLGSYVPLLSPRDLIHFGLNDLRIALKLNFIFEVVASGLLEEPAAICRARGIGFGIGGIGRAGTGQLPAEMVMGELVRLGAQWVILSRTFHDGLESATRLQQSFDLSAELAKLQQIAEHFRHDSSALSRNRTLFGQRTSKIAAGQQG